MDASVTTFIGQQLGPYQLYFEEIASFDFVPYGLTQRTNDGGFQCNQGGAQCNANIIHVSYALAKFHF